MDDWWRDSGELGRSLQQIRADLGITLDDVASPLGVNRATIWRIEIDEHRRLRPETALGVVRAYVGAIRAKADEYETLADQARERLRDEEQLLAQIEAACKAGGAAVGAARRGPIRRRAGSTLRS
jgi:DNA-binding XRE family transcriptional regulator